MSPSVSARDDHESLLEVLWCAEDDWDTLSGRGPEWPRKARHGRTIRPVDVQLTIHGRRPTVVRTIESLFLAVPRVRRLPDDRILVVGNKCVWRASGPDRNAVVYDGHGHLVAEETWGDDIFHLAVARDGTVWTGYGSMVGTLNDGRLESTHRYRVVMPDGTPVGRPTVIGRGSHELHGRRHRHSLVDARAQSRVARADVDLVARRVGTIQT